MLRQVPSYKGAKEKKANSNFVFYFSTFIRGQNVPIDPATRKEMEEKRKRYLEHQVHTELDFFPQTLLCLGIGTPKNPYFSIWNKWKINGFRYPNT